MALSRLRHPVISRAPLIRARLLSSSSATRSLSRHLVIKDTFDDEHSSLFRPKFSQITTGCNDGFFKFSFRYYSSAEPELHTVVQMPALSPTMNQGNIARWRKKEGDKIEVGDILCEIETDKATLEFESLEEGYLAKILVPEGSNNIQVGQPIAITIRLRKFCLKLAFSCKLRMVEEADDIKKIPASFSSSSDIKEEETSSQGVESHSEAQGTSSVNINMSDLPTHVVVDMPALSPTMNQGNIAKWFKKEGDKIDVGDVICEIETDKATLEFECLEEGYLAKILAPEGSKEVAVGQPIAVTVEDMNDIEAVKTSFSLAPGKKEEVTDKSAAPSMSTDKKVVKTSIKRISPSAKLLITEFGLDVSSLEASGPHGTLLKGDVLAAMKSGGGAVLKDKTSPSPSPQSQQKSVPSVSPQTLPHLQKTDTYEDLPNSQIRKVIAKRLLESKQNTPHLYLSSDVILDPLLAFRKELIEKHDVKVSVNDIVIKAVAIALRNVPEANSSWSEEKGEIISNDSVDISIAVATEKGLMTPIIRNADQKTISAISAEVKELAEKARSGKLKPHEFQGGTFSISNLGMFPVDHFCAIINPPQSGILAVGRGNKVVKPVIGDDGIDKPAVVTEMNLTLSADHRVFDGKVGGEFLSALQANFSDIHRLLL
ncbi:hypothetical protein V2J09_001236 [Rumex salicifolius]